jgi:hypothetical protein
MRLLLASLFFVTACSSGRADEQRHELDRVNGDRRCAEPVNIYGHEPESGVVSTASIAKNVAFSYLKVVYPEDRHLSPMSATLSNGVWTVRGTLPEPSIGGVAGITLCQSNGRVLEIAHGK